jgi:hypothetical protein
MILFTISKIPAFLHSKFPAGKLARAAPGKKIVANHRRRGKKRTIHFEIGEER